MTLYKQRLFARLLKPLDDAPDGGGTGTGVVDRGDDFVATDDEPTPTPAPEPTPAPKADPEAKEPAPDKDKDKPDDEKKGAKDTRLPLARHKEILDKERAQRAAVEAELKALKQGQVIATTNEQITETESAILALEKSYTSLLADGELDKAAAVMAQIRAGERAIIEAKAAFQTQAAEARAYQRVQYDSTVDRLMEAYPALNDEHEDFDNELTGEVMDLKAAYETRGLTPADALKKAAKVLLGATTTRQKASVDTDVRVDKGDLAKATAEERRKAAVAKNLEAAGKQPPSTKDVGIDSDKLGGGLNARDVIKMPQEQFNKLDEAQLAKMRGDEF